MKIVNILFALIFFAFAMLQINDADAVLWVSIYLSGSILCILSWLNKIRPVYLWMAVGFYTIYALYLLVSPDGVWSWYSEHGSENIAQSMSADKAWIENTREFFGLFLLALIAGINLFVLHRKRRREKKPHMILFLLE
ncbi:transmembrane 220 family protein [Salinimicrobium catena]|uniref:transmembrane 220 family protein n=1 Tax=Salinimicrobium catena TaxID=390640 RepID=UPI002FE44897